ncbi:ABC transporter permease subunit [Salinibacterium sp. NG22]|uniref:ABC transporter permease subunit n=1 Tax=Salinibacterium sp. NG22 TaxID=2792040 RepID=UPI0018CDB393|nr:ABC transporter permease subunit [Salinibacterium sp. NG22]MBH0110306.1 ABC transporter permease subunit [Salinibacterium sp. NG22]
MTNSTLESPASSTSHRATRLTFPRVVRSEWIKLRTLRSTVWSFAIIVLLTVAFGLMFAVTLDTSGGAAGDVTVDAETQKSFTVISATLGVTFTQLVAAVLGVLIISGEYTTGMIRSTFAAVPTRLPALFAKALVLAVATFVVSLVSIVATALLTAPILAGQGIEGQLLEGEVMRALVGGAGYLTLVALLAFGFGAILRNSAGGIATVLGLILVVPTVLGILAAITQAVWAQNVSAFLPSTAGALMFATGDGSAAGGPPLGGIADEVLTLDPTQGFLVLLAWVVVLLIAASALIKRRDA